jgi:hypothetical protein
MRDTLHLRIPYACVMRDGDRNGDSAVDTPATTEELQSEFRRAQRRRLAQRGVTFWRDTDLPEIGPIWTDPPPRTKVD